MGKQEATKRRYDRQRCTGHWWALQQLLLGLDECPVGIANTEGVGVCSTGEVETAAKQVNEGRRPKFAYVVAEFIKILLRFVKIRDQSTKSQLVVMLHDQTFYLFISKRIIMNLKD